MRAKIVAIIATAALVIPFYSGRGATQSSIVFQSLSIPDSQNTYALGISGGNIVGYYEDGSMNFHGFVYNTTLTSFDDPDANGKNTYPYGIDGSNIVGIFNDGTGAQGFLYNMATHVYTTLSVPGADNGTYPTGISGANVVGFFVDVNGGHGFVYNLSTKTFLTFDEPNVGPGATYGTYPYGISGSNVVGYYEDRSGYHGFLFDLSTDTYTTINDPNGRTGTFLQCISNGNAVGYYYDVQGIYHGFLYNLASQAFLTLDAPGVGAFGGEGTLVNGISGGNVVGYYIDGNINYHAFLTQLSIPTLSSEPGDVAVTAGQLASFTANAGGIPTPNYQWQSSNDNGSTWVNLFDEANGLSGSATANLLVQTTFVMSGQKFRVIASNALGTTSSDTANLTVSALAPSIIAPPENQAVVIGQTAQFTASAESDPTSTYYWQISTNGGVSWANLTDTGNISGSTTNSLTVANASFLSNGNQYRVVATNLGGSAISTSATLAVQTLPAFITQPGNQTIPTGEPAIFAVTTSGNPSPSMLWQVSSDGGLTWSNLTDGDGVSGSSTPTLTLNSPTVAMSQKEFRTIATNVVGSATSHPGLLVVLQTPAIIAHSSNMTVLAGGNATFTVDAAGSPPFTYQWQFNGGKIRGAVNSSYSITGVKAANAGQYSVIVTNAFGTATSTPTTLSLAVAPRITTSPASQTANIGLSATFKAAAAGTPPPSFQWQISNDSGTSWTNITSGNFLGFKSANLTVTNPTAALNGAQFRAIAANDFDSATSKPATLTVNSPAVLTGLLASTGNQTLNLLAGGSLSVAAGTPITLSANATGNALKYQWRINGKNIPGATKATYAIAKTAASNAGTYTVVVSNVLNMTPVPSAPIVLTVLVKPSIVTQPKAQTAKQGKTATFTVIATGTPPPSYQWKQNGIKLTDGPISGGIVSGAGNATLQIINVTTALNGSTYQVLLVNTQGNLTSSMATLKVSKTQ
jgi:hypothetical protein